MPWYQTINGIDFSLAVIALAAIYKAIGYRRSWLATRKALEATLLRSADRINESLEQLLRDVLDDRNRADKSIEAVRRRGNGQ